jgi:replicative DNA helicase
MPLPVYQNGQAETYVQGKGWKYKRSGDQIVLESCPLCNKGEYKFYISDTKGAWVCYHAKSCGRKGNFYQLLKEFGDSKLVQPLASQPQTKANRRRFYLSDMLSYEVALAADTDTLAYLQGRGITKETAQAWHLGVKTDRDGVKWLLIPYLKGDEIVDVKYRSLPPASKRFQRIGGGESVLFGQHLLEQHKKDKTRKLYMVEGELDAITMWQHGYSPVLSTTTGAANFRPEWYDAIEAYDPELVIVCYDSDAAGQAGAEKHIKKFQESNRQCVNVVLPGVKDVNEFFIEKKNEDFDAIVQAIEEQDMDGCMSMSTAFDKLEEQLWLSADAFDGMASQFSEVNAMIAGGYWNGQLVVVSGISGTGKTSFVLQDLLWMAKNNDPTYLMCLEMPETMMLRKIIEKEKGVPMLKITQEHVQQFRSEMARIPIYLGSKGSNLDDVERTIRQAVKRHDLKCVAFDNINYFVRSIDHVTQEIARVTKRLKELAVDLHIPIIAIAQPRKFDDEARMMTMNDLKDASSIAQDADTIILLYRRRIKSEIKQVSHATAAFVGNQSPYCLVRVEKARYSAGGQCYLYFDGARSTYRELTPTETDTMGRNNADSSTS